jgi:PIN domain nuclease of toxin-antitoxin system
MIILDTHVWYWWACGQQSRLSASLLETLAMAPHIGVSAVSCFEIAHASRRGRIELPLPLRDWFVEALDRSRVDLLPLTPAVASLAVELTNQHRDPFDRIIIATVIELGGKLASLDSEFREYPELAGRLLA